MELLEEIKKLKDEINDIAENLKCKVNSSYNIHETIDILLALNGYNSLQFVLYKLEKIIEKYEEK